MRALGFEWDEWDNVYSARINDLSSVSVWKFGSIYQCKVFIDYPVAKSRVGIGLDISKSRLDAMNKGIEYIKNFIQSKPITVEETFSNCFNNFPSVFKTRIDVIDHLFFVIGNGFEWLNGFLIDTSAQEETVMDTELSRFLDDMIVQEDKTRPLLDNVGNISFYPVSKYCSNICKIPDDVQTDWLELCKEAAILLKERSFNNNSFESIRQQANNRLIGAEIVEELNNRFPKKIVVESIFQNKFNDFKKSLINNK